METCIWYSSPKMPLLSIVAEPSTLKKKRIKDVSLNIFSFVYSLFNFLRLQILFNRETNMPTQHTTSIFLSWISYVNRFVIKWRWCYGALFIYKPSILYYKQFFYITYSSELSIFIPKYWLCYLCCSLAEKIWTRRNSSICRT